MIEYVISDCYVQEFENSTEISDKILDFLKDKLFETRKNPTPWPKYVCVCHECLCIVFVTETPDTKTNEEVKYAGTCFTVKSCDSSTPPLQVCSLNQFYPITSF